MTPVILTVKEGASHCGFAESHYITINGIISISVLVMAIGSVASVRGGSSGRY